MNKAIKRIIVFFKTNYILLIILIIGVFLRIILIDKIPPTLDVDEAAKGYNVYSLLHTGKSLTGRLWPIYFDDYTKYQPLHIILYPYMTIPSVLIFGLNVFAIRFPAAIYGSLSIIAIYLLSKELFDNKKPALYAAIILALSPWHIVMSRYGIEATLYTLLTILSIYFGLKSIKKVEYLYAFTITLGLSLYSYHAAIITVPFIFILFVLLYHKIFLKNKRLFLTATVLLFIISIPILYFFLFIPNSLGHYFYSIQYNISLYNLLEKYSIAFIGNIISIFVFFPIFVALFALVGTGGIIFLKDKRGYAIILSFVGLCIFINVLSGNNIFYYSRSSILLGFIELIAGYGVYILWQRLNNRLLISLIILLTFGTLIINLRIYIILYRLMWFNLRVNGIEEVVSYVKTQEENYDNVIISVNYPSQPFIYFAFHGLADITTVQNAQRENIKSYSGADSQNAQKYPWEFVTKLGKYSFCYSYKNSNIQCPYPPGRNLYIIQIPSQNYIDNIKYIETIKGDNYEYWIGTQN